MHQRADAVVGHQLEQHRVRHLAVHDDDALDARFVDRATLEALPLVDQLLVTLTAWGALPTR